MSFPGGVSKENIVAAIPVYFPNFQDEWCELHRDTRKHYKKWYGLNERLYAHFSNGIKNTVRPELISIDIFNSGWKREYIDKHGLGESDFLLFRKLSHVIYGEEKASSDEITVLLKQLHMVNSKGKPVNVKFGSKGEIRNKKALIKFINKKLRDINPYRVLKNELRDHFGGRDTTRGFVDGHLSKLILDEARKLATKSGNVLVYRDADKEFKLYDGSGPEVRKAIVKNSKDHSGFEHKNANNNSNSFSKHRFFHQKKRRKHSSPDERARASITRGKVINCS